MISISGYCHGVAIDFKCCIFGATKLSLDWIFQGFLLIYKFLSLLFSCEAALMELFNNSNNKIGINKGYVMF